MKKLRGQALSTLAVCYTGLETEMITLVSKCGPA